jgi:hypothetical protein
MRHREPGPKKRRTRAHVIADLSINHVERQALLAGVSSMLIGVSLTALYARGEKPDTDALSGDNQRSPRSRSNFSAHVASSVFNGGSGFLR